MPTVLLVDASFSMCRPVVPVTDDCYKQTDEDAGGRRPFLRKEMAALAACRVLDHLQHTNRLEFVSLVSFSSQYEVVLSFTRDYNAVRTALTMLPDYDKTSIVNVLTGVSQYCKEEWGNSTPCQVVLITDGSPGAGCQQTLRSLSAPRASQSYGVKLSSLASLDIICVTGQDDPALLSSMPLYQKLVELVGHGAVHVPRGKLTKQSLFATMEDVTSSRFSPFKGTLQCGKLSTPVTLAPPPQAYTAPREGSSITQRQEVSSEITVMGFIAIVDVSSPPAFSRHLLLPLPGKDASSSDMSVNGSDDEGNGDEGKIPSLCVLLHGGLKKESMVALCRVAPNWYGILYSWSDNKKKSNLLLSIFEPGDNVVPWLGKLSDLGPASQLPINPYTTPDATPPFPVKSGEKRSYNQACVVWVRAGGLQSDVQKILRHARKLPDKTHSFFKELNRVRRAALQYGFPELLLGVCSVLEREVFTLPATSAPEAAMQLQHACTSLRAIVSSAMDPYNKDSIHQNNITQLKTNYSAHD